MQKFFIYMNVTFCVIFFSVLVFNVNTTPNRVSDEVIIPVANNAHYGPDITFMSVDIKVNEEGLTFCDFDSALHAGMPSFCRKKRSIGESPWNFLWCYLKQLKLPVWFIGNLGEKKEYALDVLRACGGKAVPSLMALEKDLVLKKGCKKKSIQRSKLSDYRGIVVYATPLPHFYNNFELSMFRKKYPDILLVNYYTAEYIARKDYAYNLFKEPELLQFKPANNVFRKKYTQNLAQEIKEAIPGDFYTIKPVSAKPGCGDLVVTKDELDATLRLIINEKERISQAAHRNLIYWKHDKNDAFIVATYTSTRKIVFNSKEYDPIMKIYFIAHCDGDALHLTLLDAYWKLPAKPLNDEASLIEKHTIENFDDKSCDEVSLDQKDAKMVKDELTKILPLVYLFTLTISDITIFR